MRNREDSEFGGGFEVDHVVDRHSGIRHPLRLRTERADSPLVQCGFAPSTDVLPGHARGFSGHDAPGPSFDFSRPGGLDFAGILVVGIIETSQQLCGNVRTLVDG